MSIQLLSHFSLSLSAPLVCDVDLVCHSFDCISQVALSSLEFSAVAPPLLPAMPQNTKGCYEKIGYPRVLRLGEDEWIFKVSGATRMIYECAARPQAIAKVMPAQSSPHWREGWDQNSVEAAALGKLRSVPFAPVVFDHFTQEFANKWGQQDFVDVLIVSKLGQDLQTAAYAVPLDAYCKAYKAAVWATSIFAAQDVVVTDPHPYNVALYPGKQDLALPCDFGSATSASTASVRKSLRALCAGFLKGVREAHGIELDDSAWPDVAARIASVDVPMSEAVVSAINGFFVLSMGTQPPRPAPGQNQL